ncbi:hypothetical protein BAS10_04665 [Elizabethkingia meningoseptica]|uniref:hypothetical protein n=1 Tax=Elizabethkingia meningoseptica TaxID=238 RepID=UPI00099ABB08|nr:hypothetical protein [Elizabethkingia meningoseptica]OPB98963.1 hypothetical protein BAS10_04665 [Elizabethkingia meningoseptica]
MNVSKKILDKIKTDLSFRLGLAEAMNLSERQIQNLVKTTERGVSVRLRDHFAVEYYISKGFSKEEIFDAENLKTVYNNI